MASCSQSYGTSYDITRYTIDLALPPRQRYVNVASAYANRLDNIATLLRDVISLLVPPAVPAVAHSLVSSTALLFLHQLRRLRSPEQTEELRGIADATGLPLYLLVAFNVLLDALCGCTSGAVPVATADAQADDEPNNNRLMHFRTLDWGMDELRDLIVCFDFVNSGTSSPDRILATSIGYVGFVGFLTAVR